MALMSLPQFTSLEIDTFADRLEDCLQTHLQQIDVLLKQHAGHYTWDNLMRPLEDMEDALEQFWSPFSHLHAVLNSKALRQSYQACLPKLSAYEAAIGHNHSLYEAIRTLDKQGLDKIQHKIIDDALLGFKLSGVALSHEDKGRFEVIQARLSELSNQFENNVLDASQAFTCLIGDEHRLTGLPAHALQEARALAQEKGLEGWLFNLEYPCYAAVVTYADDRALREEIYTAYTTRASDKGPTAGTYDNTAVINEILALRHEKAQLLEFNSYAQLSLATKMASSTEQVMHFLKDLSQRAYGQAQEEFKQLQTFALAEYQMNEVQPWDVAYLSEKKKQSEYAFSEELLRSYFPLPKVMEGLFAILDKLYGMSMELVSGVDVWHPDVSCYRVIDAEKQVRGYIYVDLFARQNKRGGAWMDSCQSRRRLKDGSIQLPIATLTCNFSKPVANKPAILLHDEVLTLFHELGHCLHHVLTQVDYLDVSGIHGVEWDAVELPSQFFENWCWDAKALSLLTAHVDNGEPLPEALLHKLLAAKNFQSAMMMMRQLEFSLFDFRLHDEYQVGQSDFIKNILAEVREQTCVVPVAPFNRFQTSFSHIFAGGYAAGYYSYKWAEVLSSDAFSRFEEEGIFNKSTGLDFLHHILEVGGSCKAADAFVAFRKRPPTIDALLRHNGVQ